MVRIALLMCVLTSLSTAADASTLFRSHPQEYYTNYAEYAQGCRVVAHAKLHPTREARHLTGWEENGQVHPKESLIFADEVQEEWFVLDLGEIRPVGKVFLPTGLSDKPRVPAKVSIYGSVEGPNGPWRALFENGDPSCRFVYLLDNPRARWLRFEFGVNADGIGSRIGREFGIYKCFRLPDVETLMRAFYPKLKRSYPGLEEFWQKIDAQDWAGAASALRAYEVKRRYEKKGIPPEYQRNADLALENKIDFGNNIIFEFKQGIDWQLQPEGSLTDTERGWVHAHLARAYSATGDVRYAKKLVECIESWLQQLPRPPETATAKYHQWATLGAAGRIGHWDQVLSIILEDRELFSDKLFLNLMYSIWEHYDFLSQGGKEQGNWLAAVTRAVLGGARSWPEFVDSNRWLEFARDHFVLNVMRDVYPDGKECENSDGYVAFAYGMLVNIYDALKDAGVEIPRAVERRIRLGADWLTWILQPNGRTFMIGDSNGGHDPMTGMAAKWDRQDLLYICTQGRQGTRPLISSRAFPISGWFVMRSDWEERPFDQARQLLFTAAPYGPHGHHDQLNIYCYAYGRPLLWVPSRLGDSSYTTKAHWETLYTWSKNTVVVDGKTQGFGYEPGLDRRCKNVEWFAGKHLDLADATHTLYPDVEHRRRVLFVRGDYWIVIDDLTLKPKADPEKPHIYDLHFHFKEGTDAAPLKNGAVRTNFKKGGNLMIIPLEPERFSASEKTATPVNYIGCQASTMFGWKYQLEGKGAQRFVTVLYPYPEGRVPDVSVRKLDAPAGTIAFEVETPFGKDIIYAGDGVQDYTFSKKLRARARVFLARLDAQGTPLKLTALDAEELTAGRYALGAGSARKKSVEVCFENGWPRQQ